MFRNFSNPVTPGVGARFFIFLFSSKQGWFKKLTKNQHSDSKKLFLKMRSLFYQCSTPIPVQRGHTRSYLSSADIPVQRRRWPIPAHTCPYSTTPVQRRCWPIPEQRVHTRPYLSSVGALPYLFMLAHTRPYLSSADVPGHTCSARTIPGHTRSAVCTYLFSVGAAHTCSA